VKERCVVRRRAARTSERDKGKRRRHRLGIFVCPSYDDELLARSRMEANESQTNTHCFIEVRNVEEPVVERVEEERAWGRGLWWRRL
jgi:hypothetical protein